MRSLDMIYNFYFKHFFTFVLYDLSRYQEMFNQYNWYFEMLWHMKFEDRRKWMKQNKRWNSILVDISSTFFEEFRVFLH